jgi:hypothetical protein
MDLTTFLISVFCLVDDFLKDKLLRQQGPQLTLRDSEVLTMEIGGGIPGFGYRERDLQLFSPVLRVIEAGSNCGLVRGKPASHRSHYSV